MTDRRTDEESINKKQRSQIDGERALPEGQKLRRLCDYREVDLDCHNIMLAAGLLDYIRVAGCWCGGWWAG